MGDKEYLYYRESFIQSACSDIFALGVIVVSCWFNYKFIDGNNFIDAFILLIVLAAASSRISKNRITFTSKEDIKKYLETLTHDEA